MRRMLGGALALAAAVLLVAGQATVAPTTQASASGTVTTTVADRTDLHGVADETYLTKITLHGEGFLSKPNGFGGIYVLFGWFDGTFPSEGGSAGTNYKYVYDDESNPVGYQLFVAFPGSETEYAANGGTIAADGT